MKKLLILITAFFYSFTLFSQDRGIVWQQLLGGTDVDVGHDIQRTSDLGFIIAGSSDSQDGDVGVTQGHYDLWIIKTDKDGNVQWKKTYGGTDWEWPRAVKETSDGGYIVVGFTYSDDGDVVGFHGLRDGWVIKLNASGDLEWQKCLGGSGPETALDVVETLDGFIVVGNDGSTDGDLTGTGCDSDFWIVKLDFTGTILWQKCYGGSDLDFPKKIKQIPTTDANNPSFIVVGYAESDDGDVSGHHGSKDYWVIAINASGDLLWEKALGGSSWDEAADFDFVGSPPTNIVVVGESLSNDGDVSTNYGDTDFWMALLDQTGNLYLDYSLGGSKEDKATSVQTVYPPSGSGGFFVSGVSSSTDGNVTGNHGSGDFWVAEMNITNTLEMVWNKSFGGSGYEQPLASTLAFEGSEPSGLVVVGHTNSDDGDISGSYGDDDLWMVKVGEVGPNSNENILKEEPLKIFPNPVHFSQRVIIEHEIGDVEKLTIRNTLGQVIFESQNRDRDQWFEVSVKDWISGVYFIEVHGKNEIQIGKLVVEK